MFKVTSSDLGWKTIIEMIFSLNDEATITFKPDGIEFRCMDIDRSGMIDFFWKKENFEEYTCQEEQKVGLDVGEMKKILGRSKDNSITLEFTDDGKMSAHLGKKKTYTVPLKHTEMDIPKSPKVQYNMAIDFDISELKECVEDMEIIDEFMTLELEGKKMIFSIKGAFGGNTGRTEKDLDVEVKEKIKGDFGINWLLNSLKSIKGATDKVKLMVDNNMPLCLIYDIPKVGEIKYYLAPYQVKERD